MSPFRLDALSPRKLTIGYAVAIAALVINALVTSWNLNSIRTNWDTLHSIREFVQSIDGILSNLKDAETGQRGYLLTGDDRYLEPYIRSHDVVLGSIDRLRAGTGQSTSRLGHLNVVAEAARTKLAELERTIALRKNGDFEAALAIVKSDEGREQMDRVREELATLRAEEQAYRDTLRTKVRSALLRTTLTFAFASALALALLLGVQHLSGRNRRQLRRQAIWLSTTLRSIGDAVIATDAHGNVIFMNDVAERMTGWLQSEAIGHPLSDTFRIINEVTRQSVENPVTRVLREGIVVGLANHTILIARDGTEHAIDDTAAPIKETTTDLSGVVLVFHDVGERRQLERDLHDRATKLTDADRRKDEFLAMLAHELRNPWRRSAMPLNS